MRSSVLLLLAALALSLGGCDNDPPDFGFDGSLPDGSEADAGAGPCEGVPNGYLCGAPPAGPCDAPSSCSAGECVPNVMPAGTECGDLTGECGEPGTCDDAGVCLANFAPEGTPCGSEDQTECDAPDTCDGQGTCSPNFVEAGAACGDASATICDGADTCDGAGACEPNEEPDGTVCYDCPLGMGRCAECVEQLCTNRGEVCESTPKTALDASNVAGNNHRGNMFDVVALEDVIIEAVDASPMGNTTVEVYHRPGTWVGFATTPSAWQLIGAAPTAYTGGFAPVPLPDFAVYVPAGARHAFYVTSNVSAVALNYSNGTAVGNLYSADESLQFFEGGGLEYPFTAGTGAIYQPRVWNGRLHYSRPEVLVATTAPEHSLASSVSFEISASDAARAHGLDLALTEGSHDVEIFFRRGDASSSGTWQRIGAVAGVSSTGPDTLSRVPFTSALELAAGETVTVRLDLGESSGLSVSEAAAGEALTTGSNLTLRAALASGFRGSVFGAVCESP